jgi:hypothetical protein
MHPLSDFIVPASANGGWAPNRPIPGISSPETTALKRPFALPNDGLGSSLDDGGSMFGHALHAGHYRKFEVYTHGYLADANALMPERKAAVYQCN